MIRRKAGGRRWAWSGGLSWSPAVLTHGPLPSGSEDHAHTAAASGHPSGQTALTTISSLWRKGWIIYLANNDKYYHGQMGSGVQMNPKPKDKDMT